MRKTVFIVLALLIIFTGCASDKELLRQRATEWLNLVNSLEMNSQDTAVTSISKFLEPSAANYERAIQFYKDWTDPDTLKLLDFSIDDIIISEDKEHATVRLGLVSEKTDGTKQIDTQLTFWKKINGQWYRTLIPNL
jgi:hypothetical protein